MKSTNKNPHIDTVSYADGQLCRNDYEPKVTNPIQLIQATNPTRLIQGTNPAQPQVTVPAPVTTQLATLEVIDKFLASLRGRNYPETTIKSYQDTLRRFARAHSSLPHKREDLEAYYASYRGENSTAWNIFIRLRLLYGFAQDSEVLPFPNPFAKMKPPKKVLNSPQHLTQGEIKAYWQATSDDREQALVVCLYGLGLRLKETRLLLVGDIGEEVIYTIHGKERNEPVLIHPEFSKVLAKLTEGRRPQEYLFAGRNGQPLSDSQIQNIIKAIGVRAGITRMIVSPHKLRHTKGTGTNTDTYTLRRLMRHTTTQMTDRYKELDLEELRQQDKQFNPLLKLMSLGENPDYTQDIKPDYTQSEASELLPQLLDQMEQLGETAKQLKQALGSNGHRAEKLAEIKELLEQEAK
ncbi:Tyrosine recombinase XerC [subsurface metagenome]